MSGAQGAAPSPDGSVPPPRPGRHSSTFIAAWVGAGATILAAVITAVVAIVTHDPPQPPPNTVVTQQAQPARLTQLGGTVGAPVMSISRPCCSFVVPIVAYGFKDQVVRLEATVIDVATGTPGRTIVTPETMQADTDGANAEVALPLTSSGGSSYYVLFVLRAPNGTELARNASAQFTVA